MTKYLWSCALHKIDKSNNFQKIIDPMKSVKYWGIGILSIQIFKYSSIQVFMYSSIQVKVFKYLSIEL